MQMWGQNIEDMNKSELREFGAACQRHLEGLRSEIEALNNELTETKNDFLYLHSRSRRLIVATRIQTQKPVGQKSRTHLA